MEKVNLTFRKDELVRFEQGMNYYTEEPTYVYRYHKVLENPIKLNSYKEYTVKLINSKIIKKVNDYYHACIIYLNKDRVLTFGTKPKLYDDNHQYVEPEDMEHLPFSINNYIKPSLIETITIEFDFNICEYFYAFYSKILDEIN